MKRFWIILFAGLCCALYADRCYAQEPGDFHPAETNVWGAEYPRVDSTGRVQIRVKAPDATKVRLNFWSGPKVDMEKQQDGYWTVTTPPLVPAFTTTRSSSMAWKSATSTRMRSLVEPRKRVGSRFR